MGLQGEKTAAWFARAKANLVNGVSSQFRYWGDDDTLVIDRGEGAYVYDMDGNRYIDYMCGFGPVVLGHGYPDVARAVAEAAAAGTTFAMTSSREVIAAEKFRAAVPWVDALRFTNTGTEATMHAVRLARGYTGRDVILKFEGQYHGVHDYVMFSTAGAPPRPPWDHGTARFPCRAHPACPMSSAASSAPCPSTTSRRSNGSSAPGTHHRRHHRRADARQRDRDRAGERFPGGPRKYIVHQPRRGPGVR